MNKFLSAVLAVIMSFGLVTVSFDAEARRIGGGRSIGMQRQATPPKAPTNTTTAGAAATTPAKKSSWMGPLAGLAAGLGLAALASHLGFGEAFGNILLIGLLVVAGLAVFRFMMRKRAGQAGGASGGLAYAAAGAGAGTNSGSFENTPAPHAHRQQLNADTGSTMGAGSGSMIGSGIGASAGGQAKNIPADFDVEGFARNAKVNYIRLQAANDAGNLDDIRSFTTPEMFAEIQMDIADRGAQTQTTEVLDLTTDVLEVVEETALYVVSVRFTGRVKEDGETVEIDEIWHLSKPRSGAGGWVVAGIQQVA